MSPADVAHRRPGSIGHEPFDGGARERFRLAGLSAIDPKSASINTRFGLDRIFTSH